MLLISIESTSDSMLIISLNSDPESHDFLGDVGREKTLST